MTEPIAERLRIIGRTLEAADLRSDLCETISGDDYLFLQDAAPAELEAQQGTIEANELTISTLDACLEGLLDAMKVAGIASHPHVADQWLAAKKFLAKRRAIASTQGTPHD